MARTDRDAENREPPDGSADADSTNLIKRLIDNQPLSDTHRIRDEDLGEHRQYGARPVDPPAAGEGTEERDD